jgi:hypothetical protein
MNLDQIVNPIRQICSIAAAAIAAIALLKLAGIVIPVRAGVTELAAVGILCALVGK